MESDLLIFIALAFIAVGGGLGLSLTRNVVRGALFLLTTLLATAGIFLLLLAEFLALVQILIYGGAVTILLLFGLMLTQAQEQIHLTDNRQRPAAIFGSLLAFAALAIAILNTPWVTGDGGATQAGFINMGTALFVSWLLPFELASVILLIAMIGAVVIAAPGKSD